MRHAFDSNKKIMKIDVDALKIFVIKIIEN